MENGYYVGLDMGTGSLGWAVTDPEYHVLRKHGKAMWGVRLFESAKTAEERRGFRTARRRLDRRNWRIQVLQELFAEEISKVDPGFYLRMKESKYWPEDKHNANGECPELPYALFVDENYTDKDYHEEFPTIYHLRKMLMETDTTPDIRLIYLAIHHMMKHRGHFLLSGDIAQVTKFELAFQQFLENIKKEELDWQLEIDAEIISEVKSVLVDRKMTRSTKKNQLIKLLKANTLCEKAVIGLITGCTVKISDIFGNPELNNIERPKINFSDSGYDEYIGGVESELAEQFYVIESAKMVYDWAVLSDILAGHNSISEAKVQIYEKHKKDLALLKKTVKTYFTKEIYREVFVETKDKVNNYPAYIGMTKKNGKKMDLAGKQCSREEFLDFLKKNVVAKLPNEELKTVLMEEIECGTFLPKQVSKENGVIPYQVHRYELKKILDNLSYKLPFIKENEEKILKLFEFRIPYYVGPLNKIRDGEKDKFTWAVRRSKEKIYPWNFEDVIDVEKSAEEFIRRMTNKCTYLFGEDVLPKDSMLYSKFMVLNELNNLRIDGEKISVKQKQELYQNLFCRYRKVTQKKLRDYLYREHGISKDVEISGIDGDFKASLTAYHDFKQKLTGIELSQNEKEEIILNVVLFGEDKHLLSSRIKKRFPDFTEKQVKAIGSLSYKGWGKLSKTFLEQITAPAPETGEVWSIIRALWETNDNLMQLLSQNYQFMEAVESFNFGKKETKLSYQTVEELYVSPAVKRQIWQTLQVVEEIEKIMGSAPKRVFVEMAREKQDSNRTKSRKAQLIDLYKACKNEENDWINELNHLDDNRLRSDKLYLYYTQMGRCMYSGEVIELDELWDNTKYDIDHIYPQSKTMDDSLNNRVLVKKTYNSNKSDEYPIKKEIREARQGFWKALRDKGFISKEKYSRLVRCEELSPSELAGFIERQLVETRQSTKAVAEILKEVFADTEIVYVKAGTVSRFRQDFKEADGLLKVRGMNDLHHAKDAYLNIVVGNTYFVKFTKNAAWYVKENPGRSYNLRTMFTSKYDVTRDGEVAWKAGSNGTIATVKQVMKKNNILVTRKSYEITGGLFDQQIMKKGKGQVRIKENDDRLSIEKYGGYNKATGAYFMLVKSKGKKDEEIRTIEFVPLYLKNRLEKEETCAIEYLTKERGLKEPVILLKKIKIDTLFKVDGFYMWLSGRTGNRLLFKGANQLIISSENERVLKKILKYADRQKENKNATISERDNLSEEQLIGLYDTFYHKIKGAIYGVRLSGQEKTLREKRDTFIGLTKENKCLVLAEILHMFQCQSGSANLKMIGGPGNAGILVMNNNISKVKQISIIHQSPTGIYEKEIDLKKL
ncbi:type II CRISPR RNA-guided endonuclease Cas9 [Dorea sp. OM02-2LB]|nr:type II CRISPR RNA-guided endonuclease Cas9 [Dorea sp. OM02-2LB]